MAEKYYDTGKLRSAATSIRTELRKYTSARKEVDDTIRDMKVYWDDSVNQNYVNRYNSELKVTAKNVEDLMNKYAEFLEEVANTVDKVVASGNNAANGR